MNKYISTTVLRNNLSDVLTEVSEKQKYLIVTKKGRLNSALVNLDFFEDLLALSSPEYLTSIKEAREEYKNGDFLTHEQVFGQL